MVVWPSDPPAMRVRPNSARTQLSSLRSMRRVAVARFSGGRGLARRRRQGSRGT